MSESDDTDVLLLIPPDLFLVPSSSESDIDSEYRARINRPPAKTSVISELVGHMQSLETRISAIESRDNSLDASLLNSSFDLPTQRNNSCKNRQALPRTRFSVSQSTSLQNSPVKPQKSLSVPNTPSVSSPPNRTNPCWNEPKRTHHALAAGNANINIASSYVGNKHDTLTNSESLANPPASNSTGLPHDNFAYNKGESCSSQYVNANNDNSKVLCTNVSNASIGNNLYHKEVDEMELSEVDELLQEMEATELAISKRLGNTGIFQECQEQLSSLTFGQDKSTGLQKEQSTPKNDSRGLSFQNLDTESQYNTLRSIVQSRSSDVLPNVSLSCKESTQLDDTHKMILEFKNWEENIRRLRNGENSVINFDKKNDSEASEESSRLKDTDFLTVKVKELVRDENFSNGNEANGKNIVDTQVQNHIPSKSIEPFFSARDPSISSTILSSKQADFVKEPALETCTTSQFPNSSQQANTLKCPISSFKCSSHILPNTESFTRRQQFLSLSDFWDNTTNKSEQEMLKIKLEEEKFRREHCEQLIQELQKRLLEQQEKVAVAIRVDNAKNVLISQFHTAWTNLKQHVQVLEADHQRLKGTLQNVTEKHQAEVSELQAQIKRCEGELSKALDLAAGYKEKSDNSIKERVELLRAHADELESYKSLVQEAEKRYDQMKGEYNKLSEKNQHIEESLKNAQQELNRERLRNGEVRNEMTVIHKALDACEAELTVLRQEKGSLQLKLKEEMSRNTILEEKKSSLECSIDDVKKAEKAAKDEMKLLVEQQEKMRAELQGVYQKQVDEVVKVKLQEFQTQLDAAESEFLTELDTRQRVIAECAARKIKEVIDKHQLEINLLEEKHKEEKRLYELQLAQTMQKMSILETQLHSQRANKSQLAEQLHSVMQKQWQQALHIISGGNVDNLTPLQRINAEKFFELRGPRKSESMPNCYTKLLQEPMSMPPQTSESQSTRNVRSREEHDESFVTLTSTDETPLTSRKESKDDLRKYIKMIADMQQIKEHTAKYTENVSNSPPVCREVPRKHYTKKELSIMSEDSISWQPVSETSAHDVSEYIPISQKPNCKMERPRGSRKVPWK